MVVAGDGSSSSSSDAGGTIVFGGTHREGGGGSFAEDGCVGWIGTQLSPQLSEAVATALLTPWRALTPSSGKPGEKEFVHALAAHASERTIRALLSRDGELVASAASAVWKQMLVLRGERS